MVYNEVMCWDKTKFKTVSDETGGVKNKVVEMRGEVMDNWK